MAKTRRRFGRDGQNPPKVREGQGKMIKLTRRLAAEAGGIVVWDSCTGVLRARSRREALMLFV
jgi:hypothetical protein